MRLNEIHTVCTKATTTYLIVCALASGIFSLIVWSLGYIPVNSVVYDLVVEENLSYLSSSNGGVINEGTSLAYKAFYTPSTYELNLQSLAYSILVCNTFYSRVSISGGFLFSQTDLSPPSA